MNAFFAPASRAMCTSSIEVVPLTMLSSTNRTFLPWNSHLIVFSLRRTVFFRFSYSDRVIAYILRLYDST